MHYVCTDIHGQYDYFMNILEKIDFDDQEDHMYVLGDVIDRGPDSIPLLEYILYHDNMTLLIGNHEHMMIQALLREDPDQMSLWMYNAGDVTYEQYLRLPKDQQHELLLRLYRSPLVIPNLTVGDHTYYLAHASHLLEPITEPLMYCHADESQIERAAWDREYRNPHPVKQAERYHSLYAKYKNTTLVVGHSPVFMCSYKNISRSGRPLISRGCSGHLINIDCGCARGLPLACLRLEDQKEFYGDIPHGMKIVMMPAKKNTQ